MFTESTGKIKTLLLCKSEMSRKQKIITENLGILFYAQTPTYRNILYLSQLAHSKSCYMSRISTQRFLDSYRKEIVRGGDFDLDTK